jgi:hypothetical protein
MTFKWQIAVLVAALVFVEAAAYWKLASFLKWTNEPQLAYTSALALISLLLASIIAMASDIPDGVRKQFFLGGFWLFTIQALANVLISFQYGITGIPVAVVTQFFGSEPEFSLKAIAAISGATLSLPSFAFWQVIAIMMRQMHDEREKRMEEMKRTEIEQSESQGKEVLIERTYQTAPTPDGHGSTRPGPGLPPTN